jgi:hypothetical protein
MSKYILPKTLVLAIALAMGGGLHAAELRTPAELGYEVGMSGQVSYSGRFPSQAMENQFKAYLAWVEENGITAEHAFVGKIQPLPSLDGAKNGNVSATGRFPNQAMEDQFKAYLSWVEREGLDRDYALQLISSN